MTRFDSLSFSLRGTPAAAALLLALMPSVAGAQSGGFAIEVDPSINPYAPVRVGARVFGPVSEPASGFVRGCQGHVPPEDAGALFEVTAVMESLAFTGAGAGVVSMVVGTPDGLFQCALADVQGLDAQSLAVAQLGRAQPGQYRVWIGAAEGSSIDARVFAANAPLSAIEIFGLDLARLGAPRLGRFVFAASAETGRQQLASAATLVAEQEMRPLSPEYCPGYSRFDAADAVVTLDRAEGQISLFALSQTDLTLAVVQPDGRVICNDDAFQLNPAVTIDDAQAGDYQVFVGAYSQGNTGSFDLFASAGGPVFSDVVFNPQAVPRVASVVFDIDAAGLGQVMGVGQIVASDPMELLPIGGYCPGFTDVSAPDFTLLLDAPQPMISIYAHSAADLVLAVRAPDGTWACNDDDIDLNPAVRLDGPQAGEYMIYVGAYNPGTTGDYTLYTSMGSPNWADAGGARAGSGPLDRGAEPRNGRLDFGPRTAIDPRVILDIQSSTTEAFGLGDGCAGFITPSQPDLVISAQPGLPQLMIYMVSEADGTLVIAGPDGRLYCNDDFEQLNPGVMIPNAPTGDYAVFAGTYGGNGGAATLGVTIAAPRWVMDRVH